MQHDQTPWTYCCSKNNALGCIMIHNFSKKFKWFKSTKNFKEVKFRPFIASKIYFSNSKATINAQFYQHGTLFIPLFWKWWRALLLVEDVKNWYYYLLNETSSHYELVAPTRVRRTAKQRNIITRSELPNKNEKLIHCTIWCMVLPITPHPVTRGEGSIMHQQIYVQNQSNEKVNILNTLHRSWNAVNSNIIFIETGKLFQDEKLMHVNAYCIQIKYKVTFSSPLCV